MLHCTCCCMLHGTQQHAVLHTTFRIPHPQYQALHVTRYLLHATYYHYTLGLLRGPRGRQRRRLPHQPRSRGDVRYFRHPGVWGRSQVRHTAHHGLRCWSHPAVWGRSEVRLTAHNGFRCWSHPAVQRRSQVRHTAMLMRSWSHPAGQELCIFEVWLGRGGEGTSFEKELAKGGLEGTSFLIQCNPMYYTRCEDLICDPA